MSIRASLILLSVLLAGAAIGFAAAVIGVVSSVRVGGTTYASIINAKDLVSESAPPMLNLVEPYLAVLQCVDDSNPNSRAERLAQVTAFRDAYRARLQQWSVSLPEGDLRTQLCNASAEPANSFFDLLDKAFIPASVANDRMGMRKLATGDLRSFYNVHQAAIRQVVTAANAKQTALEKETAQRIQRHLGALAVCAIAVAACCGCALTVLVRRINRGLGRTVETLARLSTGDLTRRLPADGKDEFARLSAAVNGLAEEQTRLVGLIRTQASDLSTQGDRLRGTARDIGEVVATTRERATGADAAASRMVAGISTVSHAATDLEAAAREISASLQDSARTVSRAAGMSKAADAAIQELGNTTQGIATMTGEIAAIAGQTNLLALNATIEAAGAGEAGRGFAVVAKEVKDLARKTSETTSLVGKRLEAIRRATEQAMTHVREVSEAISSLEHQQHTIAAAVEEQSHATASIGDDLRGMATAGQDISAALRGTTEAAVRATTSASQVDGAAGDLQGAASQLVATVANSRLP